MNFSLRIYAFCQTALAKGGSLGANSHEGVSEME